MILEHGDARLALRLDGREDAPALLMINSLGTTAAMWDPQVEALAARYRVIRYDTRGHGRSSPPRRPITIDDLGGDAVAILDHLGIRRARVCGLSLGGMTAQWLGARAPDRVERLVIANSAAAIPPVEVWNTRIATVREKGLGAIVDGVLERWFTPAFRESNPDKLATVRAMILENDPEGYAACCAVVRDTDLHHDLPAIRARTLVIGGTEDQATTIAQSETMAAAIPGARLARLPAAHLSNWERPDDFTALLLSFFAE